MRPMSRRGFSLIELVIVVVIIGIIAAIAIPRMSRGSQGAQESALVGNLAVLRNAVDMFTNEHGGTKPTDASSIANQLTKETNVSGSTTIGAGEIAYGPYLRDVPPLPVGANQGQTAFGATLGTASVGWIYDTSHAKLVYANCPDAEVSPQTGKKYNTY
ncbi:MAG TPA: prepilin-type N-terminal cleavage/methylation domain-containing protein [Phycisphaerales bacterium]|nr:prepilin-type N-terminal cleavage/methylation domain-containing protein [Phycisphaerales bacterium]